MFKITSNQWNKMSKDYKSIINQNITITAIFTVASIIMGYVLRRVFNQIKSRWVILPVKLAIILNQPNFLHNGISLLPKKSDDFKNKHFNLYYGNGIVD